MWLPIAVETFYFSETLGFEFITHISWFPLVHKQLNKTVLFPLQMHFKIQHLTTLHTVQNDFIIRRPCREELGRNDNQKVPINTEGLR